MNKQMDMISLDFRIFKMKLIPFCSFSEENAAKHLKLFVFKDFIAVFGVPFRMPNTPAYSVFIGIILVKCHESSPPKRGSSFYHRKTKEMMTEKG